MSLYVSQISCQVLIENILEGRGDDGVYNCNEILVDELLGVVLCVGNVESSP